MLFADLSGFTSMSEEMDPEAVKSVASRAVEAMSAEVRRFGGTVANVMGDAVMAMFGAPVAHEDDAERAVRAAEAMRRSVATLRAGPGPLRLHIGINTGEIMAGSMGPEERKDYTAMGDTVNTAARLMSAAPTDAIYVGQRTHLATRHAVVYEEVEPIAAKGKSRPVPVWKVVEISPVPAGRALGSAPLVGRKEELSTLRELWKRIRAERLPGVGVVLGEPGFGKSRLLHEFTGDLGEAPAHWGRCLSYGEGITYWPVAEIVRDAAGILSDDDLTAISGKLDAFLEEIPTEDPDELRTMATAIAVLVGVPTTPRGTYAATELPRAELHWGIRRVLELMASEGALTLVFEDLHWAEPTLLELLDQVVAQARAPILILATGRPELADSWSAAAMNEGRRRSIRLEALTDRQSEELLAAMIPAGAPDTGPVAELLRSAAGNPLFLEETVGMLTDAGLVDSSGRFVGGEETTLPIPGNLQALIGSRLDLLPAVDRDLAQLGSVVGLAFWPGAVAHLRGSSSGIAEGLDRLTGRDIVHPSEQSAIAGEQEYAFKHILIRDVAYDRLPKGSRFDLHLRCSEWVASLPASEVEFIEILAYHLETACKLARDLERGAAEAPVLRAVDALKKAAEKSVRREGNREAERYYERALDLVDGQHPQTAADLRLRRGRTLTQLGRMKDAADLLVGVAEVAPSLGRPDLRCGALVELGMIDQVQGRGSDARRRLTDALALAPLVGDPRLEARASIELGEFRANFEGDMEAGIELLGRALELADQAGDLTLRVEGHLRLGTVLENKGDLAEAEQELLQGLALARELGSLRDEAGATFLLGWAKYYREGPEEAEVLGLQARDWLDRTGETYLAVQNLVRVLAVSALARGDPNLAERWLQEAVPLALEVSTWLVADVYRFLTEALLRQGRVDDARELASFAGVSIPEEDGWARAGALVARGSVAAADGEGEVARRAFTEALRLMEGQRLVIEVADARVDFARALRRLGDVDEAREQLRRATETFSRIGARRPLRQIDQELAELPEGQPAGGTGPPSS
ncbi:MAG TPA: adenylate/guanylate cyclase domain-containing protein [Actinomycetota bacterium]|nr:adenylate/guanylate cyclase domain-containing protein [Actinomycetota bacterium]